MSSIQPNQTPTSRPSLLQYVYDCIQRTKDPREGELLAAVRGRLQEEGQEARTLGEPGVDCYQIMRVVSIKLRDDEVRRGEDRVGKIPALITEALERRVEEGRARPGTWDKRV